MSEADVQRVLSAASNGVDLIHLDQIRTSVVSILRRYVEKGGSQSLFVTGTPGCGKSHTIRRAIDSVDLNDCWYSSLDCRIFDTDKSACKEFMRQRGQPTSKPMLEALKEMGMGILVFEHFDSIKIVKRQFFLYTLFDSIHSSAISLCVILVTSSHDPLSGLEKRVRSRFSPTCIEFPAPTIDALLISQFLAPKDTSVKWKSSVKKLLDQTQKQYSELFELSPSLHTVVALVKKVALATTGSVTNDLMVSTVIEMMDTVDPARFIGSSSQLELMVAVMCCYMMRIRQFNEFSFDQMYDEMSRQLVQSRFMKKLTSERVLIAWDKLRALRIIVNPGRDPSKFALSVFDDDVIQFIDKLPTDVHVWVKSWM